MEAFTGVAGRLPAGGFHEGAPERSRILPHFRAFGVPLDADDPAMARALHRLDVAVCGASGDTEGWGEALFADPLVVTRVDAEDGAAAVDARQVACPVQPHLVPVRCPVVVPAVAVALDVLDQSAAQRHVQELVAAADAEDRQVAVKRLLE